MFIVYLYDQKNNIIAQIDDVIKVDDIELQLNGFSSARIQLHHSNPYCTREYLKDMRKITIKHNENGQEKIVIDGVIRGIEADLEFVNVIVNDLLFLLDRRIIFSNKEYINTSIDIIIKELLDTTNERYDTGIASNCDKDAINLSIKQGETIYGVLKKISKMGYDFVIQDKMLKVKKIIGKNRTSGKDYLEYRYDINSPEERSIDSVKIKQESRNIINGVGIVGNSLSYYKDDESILEFGLCEQSFSKNNNNGQELLEEHKKSNVEAEMNIKSNSFWDANIGDIVQVYINIGNDMLYTNTTMKIEKKAWDGEIGIKYTLAKKTIKTQNLIEKIKDIDERLKIIEL